MPRVRDFTRRELMQRAGYIASRRTAKDGGWVVAYVAEEQNISPEDGGRYAVVCENHGTLLQVTSKRAARGVVTDGSAVFCDCCRGNCGASEIHKCPDCGKGGPAA